MKMKEKHEEKISFPLKSLIIGMGLLFMSPFYIFIPKETIFYDAHVLIFSLLFQIGLIFILSGLLLMPILPFSRKRDK